MQSTSVRASAREMVRNPPVQAARRSPQRWTRAAAEVVPSFRQRDIDMLQSLETLSLRWQYPVSSCKARASAEFLPTVDASGRANRAAPNQR